MKSDAATIEARRNRLLELLADGKTAAQAAEVLRVEGFPASHDTIQRDVAELRPAWRKENASVFEGQQAEELIRLAELEAALIDPGIKPDRKIELALSIIAARVKLLGLNAPTKSIIGHVDAETSPMFLKFKKATAGLSDGQLEEAFKHLTSLPRVQVVTLKDDSWFPAKEVKELPE